MVLEPLGADATERSAFQDNNRRSLTVAITDERTEVLIIEGRPRWEYGYLRNLFAGRDATVQLQTVLFEPERLASTSTLPVIAASAAREANQVEATALPADESEWFKFDLIILGDVSPAQFPEAQQQMLKRFVSERGGALVVISGMNHMPHAWSGSALEELFPLEVPATQAVQFQSPEESFRWQLTSVGQRHAIMRQGDSVEASRAIWARMPDVYWRHEVTSVQPGAVVLAYAEPNAPRSRGGDSVEEPSNNEASGEGSAAETSSAEALERSSEAQAKFEQEHALAAIRNYGAGRVLMLASDRTWRLRYRVGDTYHHRLWGQVVRWGTAQKLQAGGEFVQLGTDRQEYELGQPVSITARLSDSFFAPIDDSQASIRVHRGETVVSTVRLVPSADRPGDYSATIPELTQPGTYRLELVSDEAERVFAGSDEASIDTTIQVLAPVEASPELRETTADPATLERLAMRTGGGLVAGGNQDPSRWFSEGTRRYAEVRRIRFWDSWPLLVMLVAVFTAEWILRKKGGLV